MYDLPAIDPPWQMRQSTVRPLALAQPQRDGVGAQAHRQIAVAIRGRVQAVALAEEARVVGVGGLRARPQCFQALS